MNKPGGGPGGLKGGAPPQADARFPAVLLERLWSTADDVRAPGAREDFAELLDYMEHSLWTNIQPNDTRTFVGASWPAASAPASAFAVGLNAGRRWRRSPGRGRLVGGNPDSLPGAASSQTTSVAGSSASSTGDFGGSSFNVDGDVAEPGGVDNVDDVDVTASVFVVQFDDENHSPNSALVAQPGLGPDTDVPAEQPDTAQDRGVDGGAALGDAEELEEDPGSVPGATPAFVTAPVDVAVDDHNYFNTPSLPAVLGVPEEIEQGAPAGVQASPAGSIGSVNGNGTPNLGNVSSSIDVNGAEAEDEVAAEVGAEVRVDSESQASVEVANDDISEGANAAASALLGAEETVPEVGVVPETGAAREDSNCGEQQTESEAAPALFVVADQNQNVTGVVGGSCDEPMDQDEVVIAEEVFPRREPFEKSAAAAPPAEPMTAVTGEAPATTGAATVATSTEVAVEAAEDTPAVSSAPPKPAMEPVTGESNGPSDVGQGSAPAEKAGDEPVEEEQPSVVEKSKDLQATQDKAGTPPETQTPNPSPQTETAAEQVSADQNRMCPAV